MTRCHFCGRATLRGKEYVFGRVCDRAVCRRLRSAIPDAYTMHHFRVSLPVEGFDGPSAWTHEGDRNDAGGASA